MTMTIVIFLDLERHKYSIDGPPFSHLTLSFQVETRNSVGCLAVQVKWNSFSFSIVPTSSFCCRQRTFWRYCNYNVFERASTFYLFLLSPKTGISILTSIRNLRNGLPCEVLVSNTILVICLSRWRSSITSDRLVHISTQFSIVFLTVKSRKEHFKVWLSKNQGWTSVHLFLAICYEFFETYLCFQDKKVL